MTGVALKSAEPLPSLANKILQRVTASGEPAELTLKSDGSAWGKSDDLSGGTSAEFDKWIDGVPTGAGWEVKAVHSGDALDGGSSATGSYLALSSDLTWTLSNAVNATTETATLVLHFRPKGSSVTNGIIQATITLESENL